MDFPAWDPVLFDLPGPLDIRWYGMMYVVGFVIGQWILVRLARAGFFPVDPKVAPDLVFYCVIGVMLGGRTGYALFYDPEYQLILPWNFVQVWKGGLAFHGGLSGVAIAAWLFARKHKLTWGRVGDACALAVTPGIFAVRFANFINGELFGRVTSKGTPFAMQFPTDERAHQLLGLSDSWTMRDRELCIQVAFGRRTFDQVKDRLSLDPDAGRTAEFWAGLAKKLDWKRVQALTDVDGVPLVPFRHPSQLYEGIGEGLGLGLVLLALYFATRRRPLRPGSYIVVFLLGYAIIRWSLELVRQPDAQMPKSVLLGMTMGQTLSTGMVVGAVLILLWPVLRRRAAGSPPPGTA